MTPTYKLSYFNIKGIAEPIRFVLKYAGIEFEDDRLPHEEWPQLKPKMPFGTVPILTLENGKVYHQSLAILRFFAKQAKLYGNDAFEDMEIDAVIDTVNDLRSKFKAYRWEQDPEAKETKKQELLNQTVPFYLERLEKLTQENQGHLACKRLTVADMYFAVFADMFKVISDTKDLLEEYPNLKKVIHNVCDLPAIKKWIEERPQTHI